MGISLPIYTGKCFISSGGTPVAGAWEVLLAGLNCVSQSVTRVLNDRPASRKMDYSVNNMCVICTHFISNSNVIIIPIVESQLRLS